MKAVQLIVCPTPEDMTCRAARIFRDCFNNRSLKTQSPVNCALTGGKTVVPFYQILSTPKYAGQIDWGKIHFFLGDERYVPIGDSRSNNGMISRNLLLGPVSRATVHAIPTNRTNPEEAAEAYSRSLAEVFGISGREGFPSFDLILLGLGEDGHVASLFPETPALEEGRRWVVVLKRDEEDFSRISMTLPGINHAKRILFLVSGKGKAKILRQVLEEPTDGKRYPASGVLPSLS